METFLEGEETPWHEVDCLYNLWVDVVRRLMMDAAW